MILQSSMTFQDSLGYFFSHVKMMPLWSLKHGAEKCREEKMKAYLLFKVIMMVSSKIENLKTSTMKKE